MWPPEHTKRVKGARTALVRADFYSILTRLQRHHNCKVCLLRPQLVTIIKKRCEMNKPQDTRAFFKNAKFVKATGSFTGGGGDSCVEVAKQGEFYGVRDSKDPNGPVLAYTEDEWRVFVDAVRDGEFNF